MRSPEDYAYEGAPNPYESLPVVGYDPETGAITLYGNLSRMIVESYIKDEGRPFLIGVGADDTHYVDLSTMTIREKQPMQGILDDTTIRNLPIPCTVTVEGESYEVDDGDAELTFEQPGVYSVTVAAVPYLTQVFTVEA